MAARPKAEPEPTPAPVEEPQLLDQEELDQLPKPRNVIEAHARVEREIKGIRRLTPAQRARMTGIESGEKGVNFAYRGIDQIASLAQPLFGEYGVVFVPSVVDITIDKIVKGTTATMDNTPWTRTMVTVDFAIYGPGGAENEDVIHSVVIGLGDDNSDKGINKAMTAAFKNVLLRVLCIGDPQDDTDSYQRQPEDYNDPEPAGPPEPTPVQKLWQRVLVAASTPAADAMKETAASLNLKLTERSLAENAGLFQRIEKLLDEEDARAKVAEQDAAAEAPQTEEAADGTEA